MKLAGGASRLYAEMDQDEFIRQIREYEDADRSSLSRAYKKLLTAFRTHPFPILRAKELDVWHGTGYRDGPNARPSGRRQDREPSSSTSSTKQPSREDARARRHLSGGALGVSNGACSLLSSLHPDRGGARHLADGQTSKPAAAATRR